ncbi:MAG: DUF1080 domain-containing protein [Bryobacteraceae bacterium]
MPLLPQAARAGGPTPLFDGSTLRGWSIQDGPDSAFFVRDGAIMGSVTAGYPAWLRSDRQFENFDLEFEYFLQGWMDGGVYFHAPEHGTRSRCGFKVSLFHQLDKEPRTNSAGAIFPVIAPRLVNVKSKGEWNSMRIRMDWPKLQVWSNGEVTHDLDVTKAPELRHRLRSGYLGFETLTYPLRFRNIRIQELPSTDKFEALYEQPGDLAKWHVTEANERSPAKFDTLGQVLRGDGLGNLTTNEKFRDFELELYIRGVDHHNGGVLFRSQGGRERYEIQLHDVEEAHYPTGSLYFFKRAKYVRVPAEKWYLLQLVVKDKTCLVRVDGETVLEYDQLENLTAGSIELQAHQVGKWIEYKHIRLRRL